MCILWLSWIFNLLGAEERSECANIWGHTLIQFCRKQRHLTCQPFHRTDCWVFSKVASTELFLLTWPSLDRLYASGINRMHMFLVPSMWGQNEEIKAGWGLAEYLREVDIANLCPIKVSSLLSLSRGSQLGLNQLHRICGCFGFNSSYLPYLNQYNPRSNTLIYMDVDTCRHHRF